ncbi:MAG: tol-pal system protein YbgF [Acidobacteriota bacterium]|nr:tol-pal system protein YbgF [Acidobacteriota bacterium]
MKKASIALALLLTGCATSSDVQKLQGQISELQEQLAQAKRTTAGKEEVQGINQRIADQTQQLLKSNATLVAKVDQIEDKMNNTQGAVEQSNFRLDRMAQQLTQAQRDIDDLKRAAAPQPAPPAPATPGAMPTTIPAPQPSVSEVNVPATSDNPMEVYQAAYRDYQRGNYDLALAGFREFLGRYPNSELSSNAEYWIGESLYSQKKYSEAIEQFNGVVNKYPKSDKAPGALLKKGYAYLALNDRPRAIVQFQYVVHEYPSSRESALAKDRLKQLGIDTK